MGVLLTLCLVVFSGTTSASDSDSGIFLGVLLTVCLAVFSGTTSASDSDSNKSSSELSAPASTWGSGGGQEAWFEPAPFLSLPCQSCSTTTPQTPVGGLSLIAVDGSNVGIAIGKNEAFKAQALSIVYA